MYLCWPIRVDYSHSCCLVIFSYLIHLQIRMIFKDKEWQFTRYIIDLNDLLRKILMKITGCVLRCCWSYSLIDKIDENTSFLAVILIFLASETNLFSFRLSVVKHLFCNAKWIQSSFVYLIHLINHRIKALKRRLKHVNTFINSPWYSMSNSYS